MKPAILAGRLMRLRSLLQVRPIMQKATSFQVQSQLQQQQHRLISTTPPTFGGHGQARYREMPEPERKWVIWAEICGAYMWWWIFWHLFTDYEHLLGHWEYPDTTSWSDEELGIPPIDED